MNKKTILLTLLFISFSLKICAEIIVFKSGKSIEARIIAQTADSIKVDVPDVPITYYLDDIEKIDGQQITRTTYSSCKEFLPMIKTKYYSLQDAGIAECRFDLQWLEGTETLSCDFKIGNARVNVVVTSDSHGPKYRLEFLPKQTGRFNQAKMNRIIQSYKKTVFAAAEYISQWATLGEIARQDFFESCQDVHFD